MTSEALSPRSLDRVCRHVREAEAKRFDRDGQHLVPWGELPKHTKDWYRQRVTDVLSGLSHLQRTAARRSR